MRGRALNTYLKSEVLFHVTWLTSWCNPSDRTVCLCFVLQMVLVQVNPGETFTVRTDDGQIQCITGKHTHTVHTHQAVHTQACFRFCPWSLIDSAAFCVCSGPAQVPMVSPNGTMPPIFVPPGYISQVPSIARVLILITIYYAVK